MKNTQQARAQSVSAAPGFEILQRDGQAAYYFCCNNLNGNPILQSKDYTTLKIAENSLQAALRFAKQAKNYSLKKEGEQHFFVLKSNNRHEVARSVLFDMEKAMQNAMEYVIQAAIANKIDTEKPADTKEEEPSKEAKPAVKPANKTKTQPKYSFKIDLYQQDNQVLSGRIEYLLTQESAAFQGLNEQAIAQFMQQQLPKEAHQDTDREVAPIHQAILQVLSAAEGKPVTSVAAGSPLLFARLKMKQTKDEEKEWNLSITARVVGSNSVVLRTENRASLQADGALALLLPGSHFTEGIYRLEVIARAKAERQEAGCIFQVY